MPRADGPSPSGVGFERGTEMTKRVSPEAIAQEPRRVYTLRIHTYIRGNKGQ